MPDTVDTYTRHFDDSRKRENSRIFRAKNRQSINTTIDTDGNQKIKLTQVIERLFFSHQSVGQSEKGQSTVKRGGPTLTHTHKSRTPFNSPEWT